MCVWCLRPEASYLVPWNRITGSLWAATWVESLKPKLSSPPLFPFEVCPFSVVYKNHQTQSHQDFIWCLLTFMALAHSQVLPMVENYDYTLGETVRCQPLNIIYQVVPRLLCKYKTQIKDEGGFFSYCSPQSFAALDFPITPIKTCICLAPKLVWNTRLTES